MVVFLVAALSALVISFACSLMESCLLSLSLADIAKICEQKPVTGKVWRRFRENIQKPISVILIINTLAHTIGAAVSGAKFSELFDPRWIALYSIIFSLLMIQFTEILPKTLGVRYNVLVAKVSGLALDLLTRLFMPVLYIIELVNRPFEGKKEKRQALDAVNEIAILARFAALNKLISKEQEKIVSRSLNMTRTTASQIMVTRDEIKSLSTDMSMTQAFLEAHTHQHTRYPLAEKGCLDTIIGYVNFKDIVTALHVNPKDPSLRGIVRPVLRMKESESLSVILGRMTQGHHHIAVVEDSGGRTRGLVTLEDALEPIVGEIEDEYDILPSKLIQLSGSVYIAGGSTPMQTLRDQISSTLPESVETLNDWMCRQLNRQPVVNDTVTSGAFQFSVKKVRRSNIFEATIRRSDADGKPNPRS